MAQRIAVTAKYQWEKWGGSIAREHQAYARANGAALQIAARDKLGQKLNFIHSGDLHLTAEVWRLHASTLSATYAWKPSQTLAIEFEPFLQTIHNFEYASGNILISSTDSYSKLSGSLIKVGSRSYGFLTNDNEQTEKGWGSGLNLRARWESDVGKIELAILNAWNRQKFGAIHFLERYYDITATDERINIREFPSISGQYGSAQLHTQLPIFWQSIFTPVTYPNLSFGYIGLGHQSAWTARNSLHWGEQKIWLQTIQGRNWTAGYGVSLGPGWNGAFTVSTDAKGNAPLLSSLLVRKNW